MQIPTNHISHADWKGEAERLYQDITSATDVDEVLVRMRALRKELGTIASEVLEG